MIIDATFWVAISFFIFIGGMTKLSTVIDLADILFLSMSIPNIIGLYILAPDIKKMLNKYVAKLKNGDFEKDRIQAKKNK